MISINLESSNKEDWKIQFSATSEDDGSDIVWTGVDIDFKLREQKGCTLLEASTDDGTITIVDPLVVEINFTADQMAALCAGSYPIGCVYRINGTTAQAFVGTASIYDGIAQL